MKRILLKIALFFSMVIIPFLVLFLMPYSKEFAYHFIENDCYNHGAWIYDRINRNSTPIDIAFIGSSHTIHAFQERKIEEMLGGGFHVANLGYCRYGRNLEYILLEMLLQHKSPKIIVLEVHEDEEKNSHDIFPYLAGTKDLFFTPTIINRDYFSDLFYGASARLECFKAKYIFRKNDPKPDGELYGYAASTRKVSEDDWKENENAWQKRLKQRTFENVERIQMRFPLAYLNKMIGLLKEKNISLVFVYLPESGSKLKSPKYTGYYQRFAKLLIPPQMVLNESAYWMDAGHLNDKGSEILSEWMAGQLQNEFCLKPGNEEATP